MLVLQTTRRIGGYTFKVTVDSEPVYPSIQISLSSPLDLTQGLDGCGVANVKNEAERIAAITDPFESLREATTRMAEAQAEVAELGDAGAGDEDVVGFDVSVDDVA
jgi:hypothetical protein